ncbi:MAG: hypothetical protein JWO59_759 [Chloroflexi bacterium]|nr:hypothetical protein [Chloroflexota bacterium]
MPTRLEGTVSKAAAPKSDDPTLPLTAAVLMLGARQLADIWLSLFVLLQGSLLSLIFVLATLRVVWQVPTPVYAVIAITGLLLCVLGLVGGIVLWRRAEDHVRTHGE